MGHRPVWLVATVPSGERRSRRCGHQHLSSPTLLPNRRSISEIDPSMPKNIKQFVPFIVFVYQAAAELFTAINDLKPLLSTDYLVTANVRNYIDAETARIERLESTLAKLKLLQSMEDTNAIAEFMVASCLAWTWDRTIGLTAQEAELNANSAFMNGGAVMPTDEDLDGAAVGLCRLSKTYLLTVEDLAELRSDGVKEPSASDLIEVAQRCSVGNEFENAILWYQEALEVYDVQEDLQDVYISREDIVEDLARAMYKMGDVKGALSVVNEQLKITPANKDLLDFWFRFKYETELGKAKGQHGQCIRQQEPYSFHKLCLQSGGKGTPKLHCKTTTNGGHPLLLLEPLKLEVVSEEPRILVFYDFISSKECRTLRSLARTHLVRATVFPVRQQPMGAKSNARIGKVSWLLDSVNPVVARTSQRISAATGLSLLSAELLQIVNYGVGGHYSPHTDFQKKHEPLREMTVRNGDRLATWLMYISDVTAGGATVFKWARVAVKPEEGKAVFWYNLRPDPDSVTSLGQWRELRSGDMRTEHGACPVLRGSKWIATKWFHERCQGKVPYDRPR
ncbi:prolyl 4-hydroxylase subunit alpha-1-like [Ornithodoros turicata]|uniref:prolyl 4-hydroxylase subunit alpha-1-like n=1 Tax=Ornithodoros turicata TaxID=34597 RepID=UPI0031391945